jgi:hypothetical protein
MYSRKTGLCLAIPRHILPQGQRVKKSIGEDGWLGRACPLESDEIDRNSRESRERRQAR